jgi:antitoxin component YwqK of YwqJK toxin-antitoxin module
LTKLTEEFILIPIMNRINPIFLSIVLAVCWLIPFPALAEKRMENDLNKDGIIDQVVIYDGSGAILRVEMDENQDGFFEKQQSYENGALVRIERDTNNNQKWDSIDFFENEKRTRQERYDPEGNLTQVSFFNEKQQLTRIKRDTAGDRRFDTIFYFENGNLTSSTKDMTANGVVNAWTTYANELPVKQKIDDNENGTMDRILFFDGKGQLEKMFTDPFGKDRYKTIIHFKSGEIHTRHQDMNEDGLDDDVTWFENGLPVKRNHDSNHDGRFDITTRFVNGVVRAQEKDTDFDGNPDFFADFDLKGRVSKTREDTAHNGHIDRIRYFRSGTLYKIDQDTNGDRFFDTVSLMENDRMVKRMIDKNQNGTPDVVIHFNAKEQKDRLISDTDFDGQPDTWQYYTQDTLSRVEKDENSDGRVDVKVFYQNGKKSSLIRDTNSNGHFDTTQVYDDPEWTLIVLQDINNDATANIRSFYRDETLRRKEMDETLDGFIDVVETYDENGELETLEERRHGKPWLIWYYEPGEILVRGEEDKNQDGHVEIWYLYENGRLTTVKEDTTLDGNPDLWETYDKTRAIVKRERDLDFDGIPDFVEMIEQAETDS